MEYIYFAATDRDTESVYVHAVDGSDLTWIPHLWRCEKEEENIYHETDDYLILGLYGEGDAPHTPRMFITCHRRIQTF